MITLERALGHRWIFQKNVSSDKIIQSFLDVISNKEKNHQNALNILREEGVYYGRSRNGTPNTMGVRFSQMCFYMFGYKTSDNIFLPTPMTADMLKGDNSINSRSKNALISMFSMQFPNPYSKTPKEFNIYVGRLIVKLLLDPRIGQKLYIDEMIWFLPFLKTIDEKTYTQLVNSILEYRSLSYETKEDLFKASSQDYIELYANITHEINYYFIRIFEGFGTFKVVPDPSHNNGRLFKFQHGDSETYRTDAYKSRKKHSGYITLAEDVLEAATLLNNRFSAFEQPTTMENSYSTADWLNTIYTLEPISYLTCINSKEYRRINDISKIIEDMIYASKYGTNDGKQFENALEPVIKLFRETINVEIIGGAGNTDLLCEMEDSDNSTSYKMNIEAKKRKNALEQINARRLDEHIRKHASEFCIIVAPRFATGVEYDIEGHKIVTLKAEELGNYCYRECTSSDDYCADFNSVREIITNNFGKDITKILHNHTARRFGM